ncbi:MAG: HAD family hydrolase [Candidatus Hermodarchaeota archaeon]
MSKKWIVFDAMGVIYEVADDVKDLLVPFLRSKNNTAPFTKIQEIYIKASLGKISSFDFWKALGYEDEYPDIEKEYLDKNLTIDPEFREVVKTLKKDYNLGMLTNDLKEWSSFLRSKFKLDQFFNMVIISGDVGYRKPDKGIYKILLEKTNAQPKDIVFIDDLLKNLLSASEIGINTIRFVRKESKIPFCSEFEISSFKELVQILENFY